MKAKLFVPIVFLFLSIFSCETDKIDTDASSFSLIEDEVFTKSCAFSGCHSSESDKTFPQHGLVLAKGQAYNNLINILSKNISAKEEGLLRVKPGSAEESLLYHKLIYDQSHHGGKSYGSVMPLGSDLLSIGQIEFIKKWIDSGAPENEIVADANLLKDKTPSLADYKALEAPKAGEGFQMRLEEFEVQGDFERELFVRKPLGNTQKVFVNRVKISMRPGSHHFILYGFRNNVNLPAIGKVRELRNPDGSLVFTTFGEMGNHIFNFGGSEVDFEYTFPEGTAFEIPANATFDMNSHYFNKGSKPIKGQVEINLYTVPEEKVKHVVKALDLGNANLNIPAKSKVILNKDFNFSKDSKVVMLTSHTHKLGEKFEILKKNGIDNGKVLFTNLNWEHPDRINYSPFLSIAKGEGLTSRITYNNFTDKNIGFGFTSEDEMGIIFGYYFED